MFGEKEKEKARYFERRTIAGGSARATRAAVEVTAATAGKNADASNGAQRAGAVYAVHAKGREVGLCIVDRRMRG